MVTYFVAGLLAYTLLDYATTFQSEYMACWMRPTTSRWVAAGPGLRWIRGLIFALALYPFRHVFLEGERGWLKLWGRRATTLAVPVCWTSSRQRRRASRSSAAEAHRFPASFSRQRLTIPSSSGGIPAG
jgi:hypothetical protein